MNAQIVNLPRHFLICAACHERIDDEHYYHESELGQFHELCCPDCNPELPLETPDAEPF